MLNLLSRLSELWTGAQRHKRKARSERDRKRFLSPTLEVRVLEERRVLYAGAMAAPAASQLAPPPPPPPTTMVTLDASQNLMVQDASTTGQNDQLSIRLDAAHDRFEITDPTHLIQTDIAGATGSGTNSVYVPLAAIAGSKLIVATGAGNDALNVDLSNGLAGKTLVYDGGAGDQDALTLTGSTYESVGYVFQGNGTTQIQVGSGTNSLLLEATGVEPIQDLLSAQTRQFTLGAGMTAASLSDDGNAANGQSQLTTALGTSVTFVSPATSLTIQADGSAQAMLDVEGLDANFTGDLRLDAGLPGKLAISGAIDLHGGNLTGRADTIDVTGQITSRGATIDLAAQSMLTVSADGVFDDAAGQVLLDAGENGTLEFSGRINVSGPSAGQKGGTAHLLGKQVELLDQASIDASGNTGGGEVLIGGDFQGLNPLVRRATNTFMSADAAITASALASGDGGKIIVWADEAAIVAGSGNLAARGGPLAGNGGLIETSGKKYLYVDAAPDAAGLAGMAGTWLLDPFDVTIQTSGTGTLTGGVFTSGPATTISAGTIATALTNGTNVTINVGTVLGLPVGGGKITVNADIHVTGSGSARTLTLNAENGIEVNNRIYSTGRPLNVVLNAGSGESIHLDASISTNGGSFSTTGGSFENTGAPIDTGSGDLTLDQSGAITIGDDIDVGGTATIQTSNGDITFGAGAMLTADTASLTASSGSVLGNSGAGTGVTTDTGVAITADAIGTSATPIVLTPATGTVSLNVDNGVIYVEIETGGGAGAAFLTSNLTLVSNTTSTASSVSIIVVDGDLTLDDVAGFQNLGDDTVTLGTDNNHDIVVESVTLVAANAKELRLESDGDILADTGSSLLTTVQDLALVGDSIGSSDSDPLLVQPGGTLEVAASGNIYLQKNSGDLHTSTFVKLSSTGSGHAVSIGTLSGNVIVDHTDSTLFTDLTNDTLKITAAGTGADIQFSKTLKAGKVILSAPDTIKGALSGTDIDTSSANGDITLTAGGDIGASANELAIKAGNGMVNATSTAGSIWVNTIGGLKAGTLTTNDPTGTQTILVDSDGAIGTSSTPIGLTPGTGTVSLSAGNADIYAEITTGGAGFSTSKLSLVQNTTTTAGVVSIIVVDGDLTIDSAAGFQSLGEDTVKLGTDNNYDIVVKSVTFAADNAKELRLESDGDIQATSSSDVLTTAQDLALVGNSIGVSDADPLLVQPGGKWEVSASGNIYLRQKSGPLHTVNFVKLSSSGSGHTVSIGTLDGDVFIDHTNAALFSDLTNDTLKIVAGGAGKKIQFSQTLTAGNVILTATGTITSVATGADPDIDTSSVNGNITLTASGDIGASGHELAIKPGNGTVNATATVGSIYVKAIGGVKAGTFTANDLTAMQTIVIDSTGAIGSPNSPIIIDTNPNNAAARVSLKSMGDLCMLFKDGDVLASRFQGGVISAPISGVTIGIGTLNGSVSMDNSLTLNMPDVVDSLNPLSSAISLGSLSGDSLRLEARTTGIGGGNINVQFDADGDLAADPLNFTSVTLLADGTITGFLNDLSRAAIDTTGGDSDTANDGIIHLEAGRGWIGADQFTSDPLLIKAGAGVVTLKTTAVNISNLDGDILVRSLSDLALGQVETENTAAEFVSITSDGKLQINQASDTNDDWVLIAKGGDIDFTGASSIHANSVVLASLVGSIKNDSTAAVDVDSAGFIRLTAALDIGESGKSIAIHPGNDLLLEDHRNTYLEITADNFTTDHFKPSFLGNGTATNVFDLRVKNGSLLSGGGAVMDFGTFGFRGDINLRASGSIGAAGDPLIVKAPAATLALTADSGDIYVQSPNSLTIDGVTANTGGSATISLATTPGAGSGLSVTVANLGNNTSAARDTWSLTADGDVSLTATAGDVDFHQISQIRSEFGQISVNASRSIISKPVSGSVDPVDIQTRTNGTIVLQAGSGIGQLGAPFIVAADSIPGTGIPPGPPTLTPVTVTAITTRGDIYLSSPGKMIIQDVAANGAGNDAVVLDAGDSLSVSTGGLSDNHWSFTGGGDVAVKVIGGGEDIRFSRIDNLHSGTGKISLQTTGSIILDVIHSGADTAGQNLTLVAGSTSLPGGNIITGPGIVVNAASLDLQALTGTIGEQVGPLPADLHPFQFNAPVLKTRSFGSQWLDAKTPTLLGPALTVNPSLDLRTSPPLDDLAFLISYIVPTGNITLTNGTFYLDQSQVYQPDMILGVPLPLISTNLLTINGGVTLGGNGTVLGNVKVKSGATIDMGFAAGQTGRLQVGIPGFFGYLNNVSFDNGSILVADINSPYNTPGLDYDQLVVGGSLDLQGATLTLKGASQLTFTINPIILIDVQNPFQRPQGPGFRLDGTTLFNDGGSIRARVGQFKGKLLFNGGDGNDVVLSELSLSPPIQKPNMKLPPLRLPIYTNTARVILPVQQPPPPIPPATPPTVEPEAEEVAPRYIEVRIVVPVGDAGAVREETALKLPADWLEHLPLVLRRLPDDRYRIYLMLDGGGEERLVIDVFVKGGRPVEPSDMPPEQSAGSHPPADLHQGGGNAALAAPPAALPRDVPGQGASPALPTLSPPGPRGGATDARGVPVGASGKDGRLMIGAAAATTALIASRSRQEWNKEVESAAAELGKLSSTAGWAWWRRGGRRAALQRQE